MAEDPPPDPNVLDRLAARIASKLPQPGATPPPVVNVNVDVDRLAMNIAASLQRFAKPEEFDTLVDEVVIARYSVARSDEYAPAVKLPKTCAAWRIVNEGTVDLNLALKKSPSETGADSYITIKGNGADSPPIYPALLRKEVDLYIKLASGSAAQNFVIVYTTSRHPAAVAAVAAATSSSAAAVSSLPVKVSGETVIARISGDTVVAKVSGEAVRISGETVIAKISGETVSIAGGINVSGSAVRVSGETVYLANANRGLIFSGFATWGSGNTSGNPVALTFGPPSPFGEQDTVVVCLQHAALSADVTLVVEKAVSLAGTPVHLELARFAQTRGTSGVAQPVRGIFAGNTSGRILAIHNQTLVENVSANVVVFHL